MGRECLYTELTFKQLRKEKACEYARGVCGKKEQETDKQVWQNMKRRFRGRYWVFILLFCKLLCMFETSLTHTQNISGKK